jgi:hypothetical protein
MRLLHIYTFGYTRNSIVYYMNRDKNVLTSRSNFFVDLSAAIVASMLMHPLHFAESRMILNNRLPNFGSYKSLYSLYISSQDAGTVFRGITVHIPVTFILAFTGFNYMSATNYYTYLLQILSFHTIVYPLLTV